MRVEISLSIILTSIIGCHGIDFRVKHLEDFVEFPGDFEEVRIGNVGRGCRTSEVWDSATDTPDLLSEGDQLW